MLKKAKLCLICGSIFAATFNANAALQSRFGGLAAYDTDLDITWYTDGLAAAGTVFDDGYDGNTSDGQMSWESANAWAASLTVGGFSDWSLPYTLNPDPSCSEDPTGTGIIFVGYGCTGSDMGHLYNVEGVSLSTPGLMTNLQPGHYWSASTHNGTAYGWTFDFGIGYQDGLNTGINGATAFALAVRTGDVSAVPVPAAVWLFGSGVIGLIGIVRRQASR